MEGILRFSKVPIGKYKKGPYIAVETKEVGIISITYKDRQFSISCYTHDWGNYVKNISVRVEKS